MQLPQGSIDLEHPRVAAVLDGVADRMGIPEPLPRRVLDGAAFALDTPERVPAIWGDGENVAWAAGEPLMIAGPVGVGKTTLGQRLALMRAGVHGGDLLGMPVEVDAGRVLYVAADRPRQIARSAAVRAGSR